MLDLPALKQEQQLNRKTNTELRVNMPVAPLYYNLSMFSEFSITSPMGPNCNCTFGFGYHMSSEMLGRKKNRFQLHYLQAVTLLKVTF